MPDPTPVPAPTQSRRPVWRWALSLRGLMVLVLVIGGVLGWWVRQSQVQRAAIATIEAAGGEVIYGDDEPEHAGWRSWVYELTGLEGFREVVGVEIEDETKLPPSPAGEPARPSRNEVCAAVGRLGRVEIVDIYDGTVTPANLADLARGGLRHLQMDGIAEVSGPLLGEVGRIRSLRRLGIGTPRGKLPATTLRTVATLPDLERVSLVGLPPLTRADLAPLGRLTHLKELLIDPAPVDPAYLDDLLAHPGLTALELARTQVTDDQFRRLVAGLPHLTTISLDGSYLTDAGIEALGTRPDLTGLDLNDEGTTSIGAVTDASLQVLGRCRKLRSLTLRHGRFTAAGIDALQGLPLWDLNLGAVESIHLANLARPATAQGWVVLALHGPGITDAVVPALAAVVGPSTHLDLSGSPLTDASAAVLASLPVRALVLDGTALTDAGLATLATTTTAGQVYVANTRVTPAGIAAFRAARPKTILYTEAIKDHD